MSKRNIKEFKIVFEDLSEYTIEPLNIGLLQMIGLQTVQLDKQVNYIKELDIYLLNNFTLDSTKFKNEIKTKNIRHIDILIDKNIRYYIMGKKEYDISIKENKYGDVIFSIHNELENLEFDEIDREEILDVIMSEIINQI